MTVASRAVTMAALTEARVAYLEQEGHTSLCVSPFGVGPFGVGVLISVAGTVESFSSPTENKKNQYYRSMTNGAR